MAKGSKLVLGLGGALSVFGLALALLIFSPRPSLAGCGDSPRPGVDWSSCNQTRLQLKGADLSGGKFVSANLSTSDFRNARLAGSDFSRAILIRSLLGGADLRDAVLHKVEAHRANFDKAIMTNADMMKGELLRASFVGAKLAESDLSKAELGRANFARADLTGANISFSNLARADFRDSTLVGVNITGAYTYLTRLEGANLRDVTGLLQNQLDLACGDAATLLPQGLTRPAVWPCTWVD
tara:strand:- start:10657 stop:11376 length:720 start_codon:yes stop_codon:yes gene_type:complete